MTVMVSAHSGLELSLDPNSSEWSNSLSFEDMVSESAPLRPVTWSESGQRFYAAKYNLGGRIVDDWIPLTEEINSNNTTHEGYYVVGTFYARTGQDVSVYLTPAAELEEGISGSGTYVIGKPKWNSEELSHDNAGRGAENAVRVGIRIDYLDADGQVTEDGSLFYIYEPNCDMHIDGREGYTDTPSIDGTETLVPTDYIIKQTYSEWSEADPVQNGVQIHTFGEFKTDTKLFTLKKDQRVRIKLYIWLEGQDVDCTNEIKEAEILANIQFKAVPDNQSGLVPVE